MSTPRADDNIFRRALSAGTKARKSGRWTKARIAGRRVVVIFGIFAVLVLIVWLVRPAPESARRGGRFGSNAPVPVGVATAARGDIRITLDALGSVTPLATVTVKPQVSGTIEKIDFREGQMVKAGALLAEIDPRSYKAAVDQAQGALARDEAQYANAQTDLKRYRGLWAQKAISQQILDTQTALVRSDAGTVEADRGALEAAAVNLSYCKILSPVAGRVGLRQIDVGNYVQAGGTPEIAVVTELQPMSVLFTLPEDDVGAVSERLHAGAKLPVTAFDRSLTTMIASGTLATVDNEIDPTTGSVKLRALFDNTDNHLFPNQFVNIRLLVNTLHGQTTVPAAAIQHGPSGSYVFVVKPDLAVAMRAVKLGHTDGGIVNVVRGLRPGEEVVVDGADRLRDGTRVRIPGMGKSPGLAKSGFAGSRRRRHRGAAGGGHESP